jgi:hypothetical protein
MTGFQKSVVNPPLIESPLVSSDAYRPSATRAILKFFRKSPAGKIFRIAVPGVFEKIEEGLWDNLGFLAGILHSEDYKREGHAGIIQTVVGGHG